jgi:hypothetical protein
MYSLTNLLHDLTSSFIGRCLLPLLFTTLPSDIYSTFSKYTYVNTSCPGQFGHPPCSTAFACWAVIASLSAAHGPALPSHRRSSGLQNLLPGVDLRRDLREGAWTAASACSVRSFAIGSAHVPSPLYPSLRYGGGSCLPSLHVARKIRYHLVFLLLLRT